MYPLCPQVSAKPSEAQRDVSDPRGVACDPGFFVDRYCLYNRLPFRRGWFRGTITHAPWVLHEAHVVALQSTFVESHGLGPLREPPVVHFGSVHGPIDFFLFQGVA